MKSFSERNLTVIGVIGVAATAAIVLGAWQYDKLPIFTAQKHHYSAYFAESSGLDSGARVQVSGFQVGAVTSVELDGSACADQIRRAKGRSVSVIAPKPRSKPKAYSALRFSRSLRAATASWRALSRWTAPPRPTNCPTPWAI